MVVEAHVDVAVAGADLVADFELDQMHWVLQEWQAAL